MENNSSFRVTAPEAAQALAQAEDVHRRAAYAGVEPWWVDAIIAAGAAVMVFGVATGTLWGVLVAAALIAIAAFVYLGRRRRRGAAIDQGLTWSKALMFGGVYAVTYAVNQLLTRAPDPWMVALGVGAVFVMGFVFLRWSSHRAARRLVETQGRTRTLS